MEGNRDEALRCIDIAIRALTEGKLERAEKFLIKSEQLYPTDKAKELLSKVKSIPTRNSNSDNSSPNSDNPYKRKNIFNKDQKSDTEQKADKEYTTDQLEAVKKIKKCKDYYEVLGVSKDAPDAVVKRAYKKLALQLHPDKNKAPGAIEAFKAVGNAVAILTDPQKRKAYDLRGSDDFLSSNHSFSSGRHHYANEFSYTRGFESDVTAEELFNMFFGGGFTQQNVYMRNRRFHSRQDQQQQQQNQQSSYTALINLLPIILLIGLSMMSSFFISDPLYSLQPSSKYSIQRRTNSLKVPYYVKDDFHNEYTGSLGRLEASVEDDYMNHLRHTCARERNYRDSMMAKARTFGDRELYRKAQNILTPSCDSLQKLLNT